MDEFNSFLTALSNLVLETNKPDLSKIRQHTRKLDTTGDLSLKCDKCKIRQILGSPNLEDDQIIESIIKISDQWPFKISKCVFTKDMCIFLDRTSIFNRVVTNVLDNKEEYGLQLLPQFTDGICIRTDFDVDDLSCLRVSKLRAVLLRDTIIRILEFCKCTVYLLPNDNVKCISVSLNCSKKSNEKLVCGPVLAFRGLDKSSVYADEYYR